MENTRFFSVELNNIDDFSSERYFFSFKGGKKMVKDWKVHKTEYVKWRNSKHQNKKKSSVRCSEDFTLS